MEDIEARPAAGQPRARRLIRAAAFVFTGAGVELVVYNTIPGSAADPNPHLVMICFLFFMAGVLLVFNSVAVIPDLPDGENGVARLEELEEML